MSFLLQFKDWIAQSVGIDDTVDRLNRKYTCMLLLIVAIPVFSKQYIGDPVLCFTPTFFTDAMSDYVNSYCWTSTTYVLFDEDTNTIFPQQDHAYFEYVDKPTFSKAFSGGAIEPAPGGKYRRVLVSYYRWTPVVLTIQALLFHAPFLIWHSFAIGAGIQIKCLMSAAKEISKVEIGKDTRVNIIFDFVDQFNLFMGLTRWRKIPDCLPRAQKHLCCGKKFGNYLYALYMGTKGLYMFNILFQLYGLTLFLGKEQWTHGFKVIQQFMEDETWAPSMRFPIQTMCDYAARPQMEQTPTFGRQSMRSRLTYYTAQCVLPINLYNDKIYASLTTFFMLLFLMTVYGFIRWIVRGAQCNRLKFVKRYLHAMGKLDSRFQKTMLPSFVHWYLRQDGVFVLQIIEHNCGKVVASLIIEQIWEQYLQRRDQQQKIHEKETNKENANGGVEVMPLETLRAHFGGGGPGGGGGDGGGNDVNVLMSPNASLLKIPRDNSLTDNIYPSYDHLPFANRDLIQRNVNININNSDDDDNDINSKPRRPGTRNVGYLLGVSKTEPSAPPLQPETPPIPEYDEGDGENQSNDDEEDEESGADSPPSKELQRINAPLSRSPPQQRRPHNPHLQAPQYQQLQQQAPPHPQYKSLDPAIARKSPSLTAPMMPGSPSPSTPKSMHRSSISPPQGQAPTPTRQATSSSQRSTPSTTSSSNPTSSSQRNTPTSNTSLERLSPSNTIISRKTPPSISGSISSLAKPPPPQSKVGSRPPNGHAFSPAEDPRGGGDKPVPSIPLHLQPSPLSSTSTSPSPNPSELIFPKPPERFQ